MILTNNSTYPVGLDISDLSIKLIQLYKTRDKIKIQALGKLNLPAGIIVNGVVKNKPELIKAIKKIISSPDYGHVSSEEVVVCLPESKTFIKRIEIPKSPNNLAEIIGAEIEKQVPMSINEIYYDYQITDDLPDKYNILIGAAPKEIVDQYTQLLDEAKLSVAAMEIEPTAICRCLLKEETPKPKDSTSKEKNQLKLNYGIIDIGASHTCMTFYAGNTIVFSMSVPISGEVITAEIASQLEITPEQAEKAKIICGLDETKANGVIKKVLDETIKKLTEKIREAIDFYENYYQDSGKLNKIILCGGGANVANLKKVIAEAFSVEVTVADALVNLNEAEDKFEKFFTEKHSFNLKTLKNGLNHEDEKENNLSIKQKSSSTFTTAIGLALRGVFIDEL